MTPLSPVPQKETGRRRIVIVRRQSRLEVLMLRHNTRNMARFQVERLGDDFGAYEAEDAAIAASTHRVAEELSDFESVVAIDRSRIPDFLFEPDDVVVAVGPDGLVANTLKYLDGQPLVGVNPDPARWDGVLLPFRAEDLRRLMPEVVADRRGVRDVTMAQVWLNDGQTLLAVNDFFLGPKSHTSAYYRITYGNRTEEQCSSGVIVSTGLGSTGWMRSVLRGAAGVLSALEGERGAHETPGPLPWDSDVLRFAVREPFPSRTTQVGIVYGEISRERRLRLVSRMPEGGVVFSDGVEADFLAFPSGVEATVGLSERRGRLVV